MTIGIVGLGLIGGSFAKAYKSANGSHTVYGYDIDKSVVDFAVMAKVIDGKLDDEKIISAVIDAGYGISNANIKNNSSERGETGGFSLMSRRMTAEVTFGCGTKQSAETSNKNCGSV